MTQKEVGGDTAVSENHEIEINNGIIWRLCERNFSYCPVHGKCPDIFERYIKVIDEEFTKDITGSKLFFCEKCGMVKMIDMWNCCSNLCEAKLKELSKGK